MAVAEVPGADGGWVLYWLACEHGRTYVGITNDLPRRFAQHHAGQGGKFTRAFRPLQILAVQPFPDRSSATKAELQLKARSLPAKRVWGRTWAYRESGERVED